MIAKRCELSHEAWTVVANHFTEIHGRCGRLMLNGVLWGTYSGAIRAIRASFGASQAHFWQAEREPSDRDMFRQAREKLWRYGFSNLFHALFGTSLFIQSVDTCDWILSADS